MSLKLLVIFLVTLMTISSISCEVQLTSRRHNDMKNVDSSEITNSEDRSNNVTACPTWFVYNNITKQCECGSDIGSVVKCDKVNTRVFIKNCNCMTWDPSLGVAVGSCFTNCVISKSNRSFETYLELPRDPEKLNTAMCEEGWNRRGRFCGKCKLGLYPPVYSFDMNCMKCDNRRLNWVKLFVAAYLPLTFFFVFVVSTGISASSPTMDAFVVYSQTISTPANIRMILQFLKDYPSSSLPVKVISTLYGVWNLDFFRMLLPPFCLKLSIFQVLALDYVIAFYPLVLIVITYVLICLYDKNFFLLVWIWKPFKFLFKSFSSQINIKSSILNAFVTFLILSYVKILSVSFDLLNYTTAYHPDGRAIGTFLYYDASIGYFGLEHLPYGILAIGVTLLFILIPFLFSLLHPLKCFRACIGRSPCLQICLDSYQGYYKDGTEGTRDCRYFSSLYLFVRIALFIVYAFVKNLYFYPFASVLLLFIVALIVVCQPFKPQFAKYNTIHALLFLNLSLWFGSVTCINVSALKAPYLNKFSVILSSIIAILPLFYISWIVLKWAYSQKAIWNFFARNCQYCFQFKKLVTKHQEKKDSDSIDSIPYRIEHSDEGNLIKVNALVNHAGYQDKDYGTFHQ